MIRSCVSWVRLGYAVVTQSPETYWLLATKIYILGTWPAIRSWLKTLVHASSRQDPGWWGRPYFEGGCLLVQERKFCTNSSSFHLKMTHITPTTGHVGREQAQSFHVLWREIQKYSVNCSNDHHNLQSLKIVKTDKANLVCKSAHQRKLYTEANTFIQSFLSSLLQQTSLQVTTTLIVFNWFIPILSATHWILLFS